MRRFGLIGKNISYSRSPELHARIAEKKSRKLTYEIIDINSDELSNYINDLRSGKYDGFNVTIPYKEEIIDHLDVLTPDALVIGAVNTIYRYNNLIYGDNTDYDGFKALLLSATNDFNKTFIVLGSGGASKAVSTVLSDLEIKHLVVSRNPKNNQISYNDLNSLNYDVIIQTTPVGSKQFLNESPLDKKFVEGKLVIDLVYDPEETLIMSFAKKAFNGFLMLEEQAKAAQDIWFKEE